MENNNTPTLKASIGGIALGDVIVAGIDGLMKSTAAMNDAWMSGYYNIAAYGERALKSMEDVSAAAEKQRQSYERVLISLSRLASVEELSNAQKNEALKQISQLEKAYGKLGISIDEASGNISRFDSAAVKIINQNKQDREKELQDQIKQLEVNAAALQEIINKSGTCRILFTQVRFGGEADANLTSDRREALMNKLRNKRLELSELQKSRPDEEWIYRRNQELQRKADSNQEQIKSLNALKEIDRYNALSSPEKIREKKKVVEQEQKRQRTLYGDGKEIKYMLGEEKDPVKKLELKKILISREKEYIESQKKEYDAQKEIKQLEQKIEEQLARLAQKRKEQLARLRQKQKIIDAYERESYIRELIIAGKEKEARIQKEINTLKETGLFTDEEARPMAEEKIEQLEKIKEMKEKKILQRQTSNGNPSLYAPASFQNDNIKKENFNKVLNKAQNEKEYEPTDDEKALVEQRTNLFSRMNTIRGQDLSDMEIRTNELTSRGGFIGVAAVSDKNSINKTVDSHLKASNRNLTEIRQILEDTLKG